MILVSKLIFLYTRNSVVPIKMVCSWQPSWIFKMAASKIDKNAKSLVQRHIET